VIYNIKKNKKKLPRYVGDFYVLDLITFVTTLKHFISLPYIDLEPNQPQVKSSTIKSAPSQNGLKMQVKSATYFKSNKNKYVHMY
jgi:hypothetical protein